MSDLIERLRRQDSLSAMMNDTQIGLTLSAEAADRIAELEAERDNLTLSFCNAVTRCEGAEATLSERIYERDNAVRTAQEMARAVLRLTDAMREAVADLACAMPEDAKRRLNAALEATDTGGRMASERDTLARLLDAWDRVDRAAQDVLMAQPWGMTEAAAKLERERLQMRDEIQSFSTVGHPTVGSRSSMARTRATGDHSPNRQPPSARETHDA